MIIMENICKTYKVSSFVFVIVKLQFFGESLFLYKDLSSDFYRVYGQFIARYYFHSYLLISMLADFVDFLL